MRIEENPKVAEVRELFATGECSKRELAEIYSVSEHTIARWVSEEVREKNRIISDRYKKSVVGTCIDCGGETRYSGKRGLRVSPRCIKCSRAKRSLQPHPMKGQGELQEHLRTTLATHGPSYYFQIREYLGITTGHTSNILHRAVKQGWVVRISRGLYALSSDQTPRIENVPKIGGKR